MAKTQITTAAEAAALVKDGMTLMVGALWQTVHRNRSLMNW